MSKVYLSNTFSLGMLNNSAPVNLVVRPISLDEVKALLRNNGFESCIGHAATAELLSNLLDIEVPVNRIAIKVVSGDAVIVFQLQIRLAEGHILTKEELIDLLNRGQASFMLVEIQ